MEKKDEKICGIVMPISIIDDCNEEYWIEIKSIISEAIEDAGFVPKLVSDSADVGVIHKKIVQNILENPVIVCDVSCKNPNVMFELGMRLAFDKTVIIIKDDKTDYSFDTSLIEHLIYKRSLQYRDVCQFKEKLTQKIKSTYKESQINNSFSPFLKHFLKEKQVNDYCQPDNIFQTLLVKYRLSVALSVLANRKYPDTLHLYKKVYRHDLLIDSASYLSIRNMIVQNTSHSATNFIIHSETVEYKSSTDQIKIKAYNLKSGKELKIENLKNSNGKVFIHDFKIYFDAPVPPKGEFNICYVLKLGKEESLFENESENMSICLKRFQSGVEEFQFKVSLPKEPKAFFIESANENGDKVNPVNAVKSSYEKVDKTVFRFLSDYITDQKYYTMSYIENKPQNMLYIFTYKN